MKQISRMLMVVIMTGLSTASIAQHREAKTIFKSGTHSVTGYGAVSNKFTKIRGKFTNLNEIYGGVFLNQRLMIGLAGATNTNILRVPDEFSTNPAENRRWQYGQFGLKTEYVIGSNEPVHLVIGAFGGAGFSLQYRNHEDWDDDHELTDKNWFVVAEPHVQLEINLFKWMRLSPGVSYRATFGSDGKGLSDKDLSGMSYNVTLKFGKF